MLLSFHLRLLHRLTGLILLVFYCNLSSDYTLNQKFLKLTIVLYKINFLIILY